MEELIIQTTEDFVAGMRKSGNFAKNMIVGLIRELDTQDGAIVASDRNIQLVDGVTIGISQVALSAAFQNRVKKVINAVPKIRKETERAFIIKNGIILNEIIPTLSALEVSVSLELKQVLGENTIINEVLNPVIGVLNQMVSTMMPQEAAIRLATDKVPKLFTQFAYVRVNTILQQYVRDQNKIMADSKGLKWFKYNGGIINDSRNFCVHRSNKYYHEEEIKSWANESWEGKIPNTNSYSIFINLGGYNCMHDLVPVPFKDVPQSDRSRARNLGLIA